ncbi:MAG: N-acetylmuramoyl-L-alanine amidase [Patescibacteria group bacterium]|nr:N-acetylmuramoyl-L-alanine amidase [Patescibacteria group bacterium]
MRKVAKAGMLAVCLLLIFGVVFFNPTIAKEKKFKTKAKDVKVELGQEVLGQEHLTDVVGIDFDATHLGLHWMEKEGSAQVSKVFVRTGKSEDELGKWVEMGIEPQEGKNGKSKEDKFAALIGVGDANFAQARFEFEVQSEKHRGLKQFTFTFIDAMAEGEEAQKLTFASRITAQTFGFAKISPHGHQLNVISREEWDAEESLRENSNGGENWPRSYHGTRKLIIHHTADATSNGGTDLETNMATMRAIYYYHAVTNGWGDIGYNALVDAAGRVYEGRYGTLGTDFIRTNPTADDVMVLDVEAAHAAGYNSGSFGVSAMGNFVDADLPDAQREGLKNVLAFVADSRGINVQGNSDFLRYDGTWHNDLNNVTGHLDVGSTLCPGANLYSQITAIKSEVDNLPGIASNLNGFSATLDGSEIEGRAVGAGEVNVNWDDFFGATEYQYVLERVFGTVYDPQPRETAWMNELNTQTVAQLQVSFETATLEPNSQYVLYVVAIDALGEPVSNVKHVNFVISDTENPQVWINSPTELYETSERERLAVFVGGSDNVGVTKLEIFFDGALKETCDNSESCEATIRMQKEAVGDHNIEASVFDEAGNSSNATVNFTKAGSGDPEPDPEPDPGPDNKWCSPWPKCRK